MGQLSSPASQILLRERDHPAWADEPSSFIKVWTQAGESQLTVLSGTHVVSVPACALIGLFAANVDSDWTRTSPTRIEYSELRSSPDRRSQISDPNVSL